jgi:dihydroorotate dehydrogenase
MIDLYSFMGPVLRALDPELAHEATLLGLRSGAAAALFEQVAPDPESLGIDVFGIHFPNPIGLAAGFDKNALVPDAILKLGFGFTEAGTVTPKPQPGNPKPRIFRLPEHQALINRLGFNNDGLEKFAPRMIRRQGRRGIVGANIGANKDSDDKAQDYVTGLQVLLGHADYFTINVSSPNTPGLRGLQNKSELEDLISRLCATRDEIEEDGSQTPLLLKIAPDLSEDELSDIVDVVMSSKIDGLIISNTTIGEREELTGHHATQNGGLSGAPLFTLSTARLKRAYEMTEGKLPLIGVGGISSGRDAYEKILAGASLVQLYTALIYQGPVLVRRIKRELAQCLESDGFENISAAVGAAHK